MLQICLKNNNYAQLHQLEGGTIFTNDIDRNKTDSIQVQTLHLLERKQFASRKSVSIWSSDFHPIEILRNESINTERFRQYSIPVELSFS